MEHERLVNGVLPFTPLAKVREDSGLFPGIYALYCTQSHQVYIGSTESDIRQRVKGHIYQAERGKHANKPLESLLLAGTVEPGVVEVMYGHKLDLRRREGFWVTQMKGIGRSLNQAPIRTVPPIEAKRITPTPASGSVRQELHLQLDPELHAFINRQVARSRLEWDSYTELVFQAIHEARAGKFSLLNALIKGDF